MLKDKIAAVEAQMRASLEETRVTFSQAGDKGSSIEEVFRSFLRKYLPRRWEVGHGEIVDTNSRRSSQTDLVIVNENHPFTFRPESPGLFFIEGVSAAGEVKTILTTTALDHGLRNSCKFKQLEVARAKGTLAVATPSDLERFYKRPPWFLVAFEAQVSLETIHAHILRFRSENSIESDRMADAVFVMGQGWIINLGDGKGEFRFITPEGTSLPGWVWKGSDCVLFDLLGWLSVVMPRVVRFEPILARYFWPDQ